ncbi:hypothetical protein [Pedobacter suwonensis]|uniref:cytochrome c biogenesis protein CcdA n=1 Tax=Pedobacter suwonensis TaxID=332999 RepID=UPI0036C4026F
MMINLKRFVLGLLLLFATAQISQAGQQERTPDDLAFTAIKDSQEVSAAKIKSPVSKDPVKSSVVSPTKTAAPQNPEHRTIWSIFLAGFVGGMAVLLMPCIFPMMPLTVSFFTKGAEKGRAFRKASLYGFFIILIYVVLGLLVTVIFGADALNSLSTNGIFNFFFFLLLVVFAASFLGAFEITLPSSWVNKMDANSEKGETAGLFFMAGTLALEIKSRPLKFITVT